MLARRVLVALLVSPLALVTACGDAEKLKPNPEYAKAVSQPAVPATINPAPPPSSSAAPSKAPAASGAAPAVSEAPAVPPGQVNATLDNKFDPATVEVKVGTEVTWVNVGGLHSVTGGRDAPDPGSPVGNTIIDTPGKTVKVTFTAPGTYEYYCIPHQTLGMKGQVVVS